MRISPRQGSGVSRTLDDRGAWIEAVPEPRS